ncbi:hypothetical protein ACUN24_08315 [Pedobacter sp. WC2501]|uniref:hypothetical protein n=1 Tax=Pedobacter sp. WC2501 TaxID=3461400 RepID=UPI004045A953
MLDQLHEWWKQSKTVSDIITGLYSSGIFLIALSLLKPRVKICDKISSQNNNSIFYIKIVNKSIFFKVYDIQVRAWSTKTIPSPNGDNVEYSAIKINKDYQWVIHRLSFQHLFQDLLLGDKRLKGSTDYAAQFSTNDNLSQLMTSNVSITVEVIAKHSLTGFTRVRTKTFKHAQDIKAGEYRSGNSCKIV